MTLRRALTGLTLGCALAVTAACAAEVDGNVPPELEYPAEQAEDVPDDVAADEGERVMEELDSERESAWTCFYAPSYDDNWHNDVTCSNGSETETPNLLEGDTFIEPAEMEAAAREHEDWLNSR